MRSGSKTLRLLVGMGVFVGFLCLGDESFRVGEVLSLPPLKDGRGKPFEMRPGDFRVALLDTPGDSGEASPPKDPGWFEKNQVLMMVNISGLSGFKQRIARSRMASKPFRLVVVDDTTLAARFPKEPGRLTLMRLDGQGMITEILFVAPGPPLQEAVAETAR